MASRLYREGKNTWRFAVSQGPVLRVDRKTQLPCRRYAQKWIRIRAASAQEAQAKQAEILAQLSTGTYVEPSKLTLKEFVEGYFLPHLEGKQRSKATVDSYTRIFRLHIEPELGHLRLHQITPLRVDRWMNTLRRVQRPKKASQSGCASPKLRPRSIQYWRAVLHRALAYAVEMKLLRENPVSSVRPPRVPKTKPKAFTPEELSRVLEVALQSRYGALLWTAARTGARIGELLGLEWGDVDLQAGQITFRRVLLDAGSQRGGRPPEFRESTKDNEVRVVPIEPELAEVLRAWRQHWLEERARAQGGYFDTFRLVFPTQSGWPMSRSTLHRDLASILRRAGVPKLSVHKFRHTFATLLLDSGADVQTVADLLGHACIQLTYERYVAERKQAKQQAVARLGAYLRRVREKGQGGGTADA